MTDIKCLDSSAWLAYYFGESLNVKEIIDTAGIIITSSLCLFEIKKKLRSLKKEDTEFLQFVKQRSGIIPPTTAIVEQAADLAIEHKLGAIDALIYATALAHHSELVTGDNDFRGLKNTRIVQ